MLFFEAIIWLNLFFIKTHKKIGNNKMNTKLLKIDEFVNLFDV